MFSQRVPRSNLSIHLSNHPSTHSLPTLLPPVPRVVFVVRFLLDLLLSTSPFRILSSYSASAPSARYSPYELLKNAPRTYYMPSHPCLIHRICPWKLLLLSQPPPPHPHSLFSVRLLSRQITVLSSSPEILHLPFAPCFLRWFLRLSSSSPLSK